MPRGVYSSQLRGLGSSSVETRKRVSQTGGLVCFINADEEFLQARAEKGGASTITRYGREHFVKIARKRWSNHKKENSTMKPVQRDSGAYVCPTCKKHRNTLRSILRHRKQKNH